MIVRGRVCFVPRTYEEWEERKRQILSEKEYLEKRVEQVEAIARQFDREQCEIRPTLTKPFFKTDSIAIYNEDLLNIEAIENNSIDLIVTSPPYNVDLKYETYDDKIPYDKYLEFSEKWLTKCYNLTKDDGRLCLNIPLNLNKGGQQSVCADLTTIAKKVGWKYHATIIWNKQNISRRTAWGSWLSASAPFVIAPVEVIVVLYKKRWKKTSGSRKSNIIRDEFLEWTNAVWNFSGESKNKIGHPSPFPIELPKRCIKLFSFVEDTILDPFLGSGTTLIACLETDRKGIGIEIDRNYCELAVKRLKEYGYNMNPESATPKSFRQQSRPCRKISQREDEGATPPSAPVYLFSIGNSKSIDKSLFN